MCSASFTLGVRHACDVPVVVPASNVARAAEGSSQGDAKHSGGSSYPASEAVLDHVISVFDDDSFLAEVKKA